MKQIKPSLAAAWQKYVQNMVLFILVLLPFQAFLSVWLASAAGQYRFIEVWPELLLLIISVGLLIYLGPRQLAAKLERQKPLAILIFIYILMMTAYGIYALGVGHVSVEALVFALTANLRFLVIFLVAFVAFEGNGTLRRLNWAKIILLPAAVVIGFGLLQILVLPPRFLTHFGYSDTTIAAVHYVDNKPGFVRIESTLRGPNPLGAYLVIPVTVLAALFLRIKQAKYRAMLGILGIGTLTVLFFTYSRSAWIGVLASIALFVWWSLKQRKLKRQLLIVSSGLVVLSGFLLVMYRHNRLLQNALFHTDTASTSPTSSNAVRSSDLRSGVNDIMREPLGRGPGTAGPASVHNQPRQSRIAENYFLQIGQEVGVVGLGLFLAINVLLARALWLRRSDSLALILLASLAGITLINMLSHAWTDDTLALLWWGLAGIALGAQQTILKSNRYEKIKN